MAFARGVLRLALSLVLAVLLGACSDAPDEALVTRAVAERLAGAFEPGTFALSSLRRLGSGPLADSEQGRPQRIVYYNAVLRLERELDFSGWDSLNVAAFANLLGATQQGITGLAQGGNRTGDRIYVHGTASFERGEAGWEPVAYVAPEVGTPVTEYNSGPPAESRRVVERIAALFGRRTADPVRQRAIIVEELDAAYATIEVRLDRLDRAFVVGGGPEDGEYLKVAKLLARAMTHEGVAATAVVSNGSTDNIRLLREGRADVALVQNDIAMLASLGTGAFQHDGPYYGLRALASLFPEPIHVIVPKDSAIRSLRDLAGKRVEIGKPNSGSRVNSIALLDAAGLSLDQLQAIHETGLENGLRMLAGGQVDAVIATVSAPARGVQKAAAGGHIRLLSLAPEATAALTKASTEFVPIRLPASTYPNQQDAVATVAVTALLVATDGLARREVEQVLRAVFDQVDFLAAGSAPGSLITRATANLGLTVPLHPAAIDFFGPGKTAPPAAAGGGP